jgi:hypothetical protein
VQLLLERGADVNAQGGVYGKPLHAACSEWHEIVEIPLQYGADLTCLTFPIVNGAPQSVPGTLRLQDR